MATAVLILLALFLIFVVLVLAKTIRIIPQARAGIVERFGKYKTTLPARTQRRHAVRRPGALRHRHA